MWLITRGPSIYVGLPINCIQPFRNCYWSIIWLCVSSEYRSRWELTSVSLTVCQAQAPQNPPWALGRDWNHRTDKEIVAQSTYKLQLMPDESCRGPSSAGAKSPSTFPAGVSVKGTDLGTSSVTNQLGSPPSGTHHSSYPKLLHLGSNREELRPSVALHPLLPPRLLPKVSKAQPGHVQSSCGPATPAPPNLL